MSCLKMKETLLTKSFAGKLSPKNKKFGYGWMCWDKMWYGDIKVIEKQLKYDNYLSSHQQKISQGNKSIIS